MGSKTSRHVVEKAGNVAVANRLRILKLGITLLNILQNSTKKQRVFICNNSTRSGYHYRCWTPPAGGYVFHNLVMFYPQIKQNGMSLVLKCSMIAVWSSNYSITFSINHNRLSAVLFAYVFKPGDEQHRGSVFSLVGAISPFERFSSHDDPDSTTIQSSYITGIHVAMMIHWLLVLWNASPCLKSRKFLTGILIYWLGSISCIANSSTRMAVVELFGWVQRKNSQPQAGRITRSRSVNFSRQCFSPACSWLQWFKATC